MTIQVIRRFFLLRPLRLSVLVLALYVGLAWGARWYCSPPPVSSGQTNNIAKVQTDGESVKKTEAIDAKVESAIPWHDYHEALKTERELLAQQVDRQERLLLGVGAFLVGLVIFLFGQTRRDVVAQLRDDTRERIRDEIERELADARARVREDVGREVKLQFAGEVKKTVGDYIEAHYKTQPIRWVTAEESDTQREVMEALQTLKFTNVQRVNPDNLEALAGARLIIFSYGKVVPAPAPDGNMHDLTDDEKIRNERALAELIDVARWVRRQPVPTPLVIHNKSNNALQKEETDALQGTVSVPANFSSTVITHTLTLLHR